MIDLEKYYSANDIFSVCLAILNSIFDENQLSKTDLSAINIMLKFKYSFKNITDVNDKGKLMNLPIKILKSLIKGKNAEGQKKKKD